MVDQAVPFPQNAPNFSSLFIETTEDRFPFIAAPNTLRMVADDIHWLRQPDNSPKFLVKGLSQGRERPAFVVIGKENAGKSSFLEAMIGMPLFPRAAAATTRFACELYLEPTDEKAHWKMEWRSTTGFAQNEPYPTRPQQITPEMLQQYSSEPNQRPLNEVLNQMVRDLQLHEADRHPQFYSDVLQVTIYANGLTPCVFVDTPGILPWETSNPKEIPAQPFPLGIAADAIKSWPSAIVMCVTICPRTGREIEDSDNIRRAIIARIGRNAEFPKNMVNIFSCCDMPYRDPPQRFSIFTEWNGCGPHENRGPVPFLVACGIPAQAQAEDEGVVQVQHVRHFGELALLERAEFQRRDLPAIWENVDYRDQCTLPHLTAMLKKQYLDMHVVTWIPRYIADLENEQGQLQHTIASMTSNDTEGVLRFFKHQPEPEPEAVSIWKKAFYLEFAKAQLESMTKLYISCLKENIASLDTMDLRRIGTPEGLMNLVDRSVNPIGVQQSVKLQETYRQFPEICRYFDVVATSLADARIKNATVFYRVIREVCDDSILGEELYAKVVPSDALQRSSYLLQDHRRSHLERVTNELIKRALIRSVMKAEEAACERLASDLKALTAQAYNFLEVTPALAIACEQYWLCDRSIRYLNDRRKEHEPWHIP